MGRTLHHLVRSGFQSWLARQVPILVDLCWLHVGLVSLAVQSLEEPVLVSSVVDEVACLDRANAVSHTTR